MTEGQVATSLLIVFISATLWAPGLAYLSRKTSKTFAWIFAMASWGLLLLVFPLFVLEPGSITMLYVWMALMGAGVGGQYQVAWSMIPDCVEVDEYITGKRREGIYYAIVTFTQKAATAAAYFAAGILLAWVGYEAGVDPTPETLEGLKNTFAYGSALPLFLSCLVAFLNPMTRQRHKSLCEALRLRRDGKQHSVADFRELLAGHTLVAE